MKPCLGDSKGPRDDPSTIATPRCRLRRWCADDREPFAEINADPRVMAYFPAPLTRAQSDALIERIEAHFDRHGFGLWALERLTDSRLLGFVGLAVPSFQAPFTPCVEIGWRLAADHWGRGYASEAAGAVARTAFGQLNLDEIVSFTAVGNRRSRAVMTRIGMRHATHEDFEHPSLAPGHRLRAHVLYRLDRSRWQSESAADVGHPRP
ncbi:MAG: GNAT family N-acetyltransferase [Burkholderiaceae bacterium]